MDNRVANNTSRIPGSNAVALPTPRLPLGSNGPVTLNTMDAASFSARPGNDLDSVESKIRELDDRISALESQVGQIGQDPGFATNAAYNAGPRPAAYNNAPAAYNQAPAAYNQAPAAYNPAPVANNAPYANNTAAYNNAPANNGQLINLNANNGNYSGVAPYQVPPPPQAAPPLPPPPPVPPPPAPLPGMNGPSTAAIEQQNAQMRAELAELHAKLNVAMGNVNRLLIAQQQQQLPRPSQVDISTQPAGPMPASNAAADEMARQQAGMAAVQNVLREVKPGTYNAQEQATINGAVKRVKQIGQEIAGGADPAQYAAELFALKHTISDPAGVGNHRNATSGAQVIQLAEEAKGKLKGDLDKLAQVEQRRPLNAREAAKKADLTARYADLVKVEKALDAAKLTKLTPAGDKVAADAVNRLGVITEGLAAGKQDPQAVDQEIYQLGQILRDPNHPPRLEAVEAGAAVVRQIDANASELKHRLSEIDDKIASGAAPEAYAAERADLMDRLEALNELGTVVRGARADQRDQASRRDVAMGLQQAAAIADAIGQGDGPAAHRAQVFVLKQTFQEPRASRDNAAIQAGAATVQLLGRAEARIQRQREAIQSEIARGADPRSFDQQSAALNRRAEDLEAMRHAIEGADFGGLTPAQEAHGAEVIDQMRGLAVRVANGEDFAKVQRPYQLLTKQLMDLHTWRGPTLRPEPLPVQPRDNRPVLRPLPAATSGDEEPQPAAAKPAPKPVAKPEPKPAAEPKTRNYAVQQDDYLTKIAREQLGDANRWPEIVELNKDKYPGLASNPDLIYEGWNLKLPAGGATQPAKPSPKPAPKPEPSATEPANKPKPRPKPPVVVTPPQPEVPANQCDREAVEWLRQKVAQDGMISREEVQRCMPEGRGKQDTLKYFDALMFGYIDPGAEGWNNLFPGDIDRMQRAVDHDHTIKELADRLSEAVLNQREVGDLNQDGRIDDADLKAYVADLRGMTQPKPPAPKPEPKPTPAPASNDARLQRELQTYLDDPNNKGSDAALSLVKNHPQFAAAATPAQKAQLVMLVLDGHASKDDKAAALQVLQTANERNELDATLTAINSRKGAMKDLLSTMDSVDFAKLLLADDNAYADPAIFGNMDDNAAATLCKALGFKHPMVGQSDALLALPEEAKYKLVKELTSGNVTWNELYMAQWINSHCEIPYRIPEYLTKNDNE